MGGVKRGACIDLGIPGVGLGRPFLGRRPVVEVHVLPVVERVPDLVREDGGGFDAADVLEVEARLLERPVAPFAEPVWCSRASQPATQTACA